MCVLLAIDPGSSASGWVVYNSSWGVVLSAGIDKNEVLLERLRSEQDADQLVVEMIASYGMPVGREVFETCVWIGRFKEAYDGPSEWVYRREVKLALCDSPRAKDANVRQALIDMFGPGKGAAIGTKKVPGPLYGFKADMWAALGVAVAWVQKGGFDGAEGESPKAAGNRHAGVVRPTKAAGLEGPPEHDAGSVGRKDGVGQGSRW